MPPRVSRLQSNLPEATQAEVVELLAGFPTGARVERITSHGQASPPGFWYDQDQPEWVLLVSGSARLAFDDGEVALSPGDSLLLPARCRHRVAWTTPDAPTVWLAVFLPVGT